MCLCAAPLRVEGCIASKRWQPMQACATRHCCNADVDVVLLRHVLLLGASLTVIVAGCVLVGSTHGCGRMHCNHQELPLQVQSCAFIANARSKCKRTVLAFLLSVAACTCSHAGWLWACGQHPWVWQDALQASGAATASAILCIH